MAIIEKLVIGAIEFINFAVLVVTFEGGSRSGVPVHGYFGKWP
jgi:hypothetical protein